MKKTKADLNRTFQYVPCCTYNAHVFYAVMFFRNCPNFFTGFQWTYALNYYHHVSTWPFEWQSFPKKSLFWGFSNTQTTQILPKSFKNFCLIPIYGIWYMGDGIAV
jgi:hypothetical protein